MSPKEVIFSSSAEKEIKALQKQDQKLVMAQLDRLATGGGQLDIEKIKTHPTFFRIKAAHLRIVYYPLSPTRVVVLLVRNRKDAYRSLNVLERRLETAMANLDSSASRSVSRL